MQMIRMGGLLRRVGHTGNSGKGGESGILLLCRDSKHGVYLLGLVLGLVRWLRRYRDIWALPVADGREDCTTCMAAYAAAVGWVAVGTSWLGAVVT